MIFSMQSLNQKLTEIGEAMLMLANIDKFWLYKWLIWLINMPYLASPSMLYNLSSAASNIKLNEFHKAESMFFF